MVPFYQVEVGGHPQRKSGVAPHCRERLVEVLALGLEKELGGFRLDFWVLQSQTNSKGRAGVVMALGIEMQGWEQGSQHPPRV